MGKGGHLSKHIRAKKFAAAKIKGMTNADAAMVAAPNIKPGGANTLGQHLSDDPLVLSYVRKELEKQNISLVKALKRIAEGLDADKPLIIRDPVEATRVEWVPDHAIRLGAAQKVLQLWHAYDYPVTEPLEPAANRNFIETPADNTALRQALVEAMQRGDVDTVERIVFKKQAELNESTDINK